jgi:hypothetical protein
MAKASQKVSMWRVTKARKAHLRQDTEDRQEENHQEEGRQEDHHPANITKVIIMTMKEANI